MWAKLRPRIRSWDLSGLKKHQCRPRRCRVNGVAERKYPRKAPPPAPEAREIYCSCSPKPSAWRQAAARACGAPKSVTFRRRRSQARNRAAWHRHYQRPGRTQRPGSFGASELWPAISAAAPLARRSAPVIPAAASACQPQAHHSAHGSMPAMAPAEGAAQPSACGGLP
jgi:hypothetical protein